MQVRYQAALRPEAANYSSGKRAPRITAPHSAAQYFDDVLDFLAQHRGERHALAPGARAHPLGRLRYEFVEAVARAADGEALVVEQLADAADEQHLVVLVVASVAAALDRLQLGEFLLPVAQHMRLHAAQLAYLTDREVALRRDRRQLRPGAMTCFHGSSAPPSPSASATRGTSRRGAP